MTTTETKLLEDIRRAMTFEHVAPQYRSLSVSKVTHRRTRKETGVRLWAAAKRLIELGLVECRFTHSFLSPTELYHHECMSLVPTEKVA